MKRIKFLLLGLSLVGAVGTFAQETPAARGLSLSLGVDGGIPIGSFASDSKYKFGLGGSAELALPLTKNLDGTISAGYIAFSRSKINEVRNENTFTAIPFKAGLKVRTNSGFYFQPQLGLTQTKISDAEGAGVFTYAANVGFLIAKAVDLSVRYEAMAPRKGKNIPGATSPQEDVSAKIIGLRLAYNIPFARVK